MISVLHIHGRMAHGGAEIRTVELMPLMAEKAVHFDYCTLTEQEGALDAKVRQLGGNVHTCRLRPDTWSFGKRFVRFLKQSNYDIIHTHLNFFSGYIVRLAYKAGIKSRIVHFRNVTPTSYRTLRKRLYTGIMHKLIDKHATAILAVSRSAMESSWGRNWQKEPRCQVVYNGLDLSAFQGNGNERQSVLAELGLPQECKLVINVAIFRAQKAPDVLLDAAASIIQEQPDCHFLFAGIGELLETMQAKVRQLGISKNVHFLGLRNDVPRLLKACDCFVLSSRWEGLPGVVLESVAAQLPVVATDLPGVREIAEHTDLITTVPVGDSDAICKETLKVINRGRVQHRSEKPFPLAFDLSRCAEKLFEIYISQVGQAGKLKNQTKQMLR